jgi:hypothetical protein
VRPRILSHLLAAVFCLTLASDVRADPVYVSRVFSHFGTVDLLTGAYTDIATTSVQLNALTFASNGTLYGIGSDNHLYTVNTTTGALTDVGNTGSFFALNSLAAGSNGKLFGEDPFGNLFSIDPQTGKATEVGPANEFGLHPTGTLAFGPGDMLFTDISFFGDFLNTQDQSNGMATKVGSTALDINFPGGLFFDNGQAFAFGFFGELFSINTGTGTANSTGVTISGGFGPVLGAAAGPAENVVPEPSGFVLFLSALALSGGAWRLAPRRRPQQAA